MATIPIGGGRRVIQGQAIRTGVPDQGDMSAATARAGQALAGFGLDRMQQETRLRLQATDEAAQLAEAAERQREAMELDKRVDALRDASDELGEQMLRGEVPKDQVEQQWAERAGKIQSEAMPGFRDQTKALAQQRMERFSLTFGNSLRKLRTQKDRSDITAGIDTQLESLQREYRTDPEGATKMATALLAEQGPLSNYSTEQLQRKGQAWKEGVQFTTGFEAISAGRADPKALKLAEELVSKGLPDLDPQRRAQLLDRAQGYRLAQQQQAELAAQHAQREDERRMREAEAAFNNFQTLADKGTVLAPEYIDRATRATAGTPYQQGITMLAEQAVRTGGLAAQPIANQRGALQALDSEIATRGRTPELDKRREQLVKVLNGSEADLASDGLSAALERGVVTRVEPLNLQGGLQGVVGQLQQRSFQADLAATWAGRPVSPLTGTESNAVGDFLRAMPSDQRAAALQSLAMTMKPEQAQAFAGQLDKQDRGLALALGYGAARTTYNRPTAELILRGQEALKAKTVKLDDSAEVGLTASIDAELRGAITNPEQLEKVRDAAKLMWAGKAAEGERVSVPSIVRLAVGGQIVNRNGGKLVLPAGVDEDAFEQHLDRYPAPALAAQLPDGKAYVRGQPVDSQQFLASLPSAQLRTLGRGRYAVLSGGAVATNAQGAPIIVEAPGAR